MRFSLKPPDQAVFFFVTLDLSIPQSYYLLMRINEINLIKRVSVMQALADETRIRALMLLTHGELRVDDLMQALELPQSKVSRHLSYLKNAALVTDRRQWNQIFYAIDTHDQVISETVMPFLRSYFKDLRELRADQERLRRLPAFSSDQGVKKDRRVKVLFICEHNSARSQMAEAYLNALAGNAFRAESAGIIPSSIHPLVIALMKEDGLDISRQRSKRVDDLSMDKRSFDIVVTVCDESRLEACPVFKGEKQRLHWDIADPSAVGGSAEQHLSAIRVIRDKIKAQVSSLIQSNTLTQGVHL